eukprot:725983-Amphidinium_carterae.1
MDLLRNRVALEPFAIVLCYLLGEDTRIAVSHFCIGHCFARHHIIGIGGMQDNNLRTVPSAASCGAITSVVQYNGIDRDYVPHIN